MGWLVSDLPLTHETPAAYLTRHYTGKTEEARSEVLAASQVGRAVYMAVRHIHKAGGHAGRGYVYAAIILVFNNARDGLPLRRRGPSRDGTPAALLRHAASAHSSHPALPTVLCSPSCASSQILVMNWSVGPAFSPFGSGRPYAAS